MQVTTQIGYGGMTVNDNRRSSLDVYIPYVLPWDLICASAVGGSQPIT